MADQMDYQLFLSEYGLSDALVIKDMNVVPCDVEKSPGAGVVLGISRLHGTGVFALQEYKAGEYVCLTKRDGQKEPAGRYMNHSKTPNVLSVRLHARDDGDIIAIALRDINAGDEILVNYRQNMGINGSGLVPVKKSDGFDLTFFTQEIDLDAIEIEMKKLPQVECPVSHLFVRGVYCRTMSAPAGTFILGKQHRHETLNIMLEGEASIYMGGGRPAKRLTAPCVFVADKWSQKLGYIHKDMVYLTIHKVESENLDDIEKDIFVTGEECSSIMEAIQ